MAKQAEVIAALELAGRPQTVKQICKWIQASTKAEQAATAVCLSTMASKGKLHKAHRETSDDFNGGKATVYWLPDQQGPAVTPPGRPAGFRELPDQLIPRIPRLQVAAPGIRVDRPRVEQRFSAGPSRRRTAGASA